MSRRAVEQGPRAGLRAVDPRVLYGAYLLLTGAWPILDRRSFEALTGRKRDFWLARCVGGLSMTIGVALTRRPRNDLVAGSMLTFVAADAHAARRYSRAYAADAVVQVCAAAAALRWAGARSDEDEPRCGIMR
jgi:hypothetical protein